MVALEANTSATATDWLQNRVRLALDCAEMGVFPPCAVIPDQRLKRIPSPRPPNLREHKAFWVIPLHSHLLFKPRVTTRLNAAE